MQNDMHTVGIQSLIEQHYQRHELDLPFAKRLVFSLIEELRGRKGIGDVFDQIDADVQEELLATLITMTERAIEELFR